MRNPFSGYSDDNQHGTNLYRICEPGLGGRTFRMRGISITNPGDTDYLVKIYDEAEADTPTTPTAAKQRLAIMAKAGATTVVDFSAPGIKFVDDVGAVSNAAILAYDIAVWGWTE